MAGGFFGVFIFTRKFGKSKIIDYLCIRIRAGEIPALFGLKRKFIIMTRYKKIIKEKGIKLGWVANQVNIPQSTLSNYINGKRDIPSDIEFKLNKVLA